jgi:LacI family transcriptional regulator
MKTVSRVLNAEPHVREELRAKVLKAAKDLSYRPKTSARSLAGAKSFVVAHLFSKLSPYLVMAQLGALGACRAAGYHLLVETIDLEAGDPSAELASLLLGLGVDGVLLLPPVCDDERVLDALDGAGAAYVRISPARDLPRSPFVEVEDETAARSMTQHLIGLGHRCIGFVTGPDGHAASGRRLSGFRGAVQAAGLVLEEELIQPGDFTFHSGQAAAQTLLGARQPPTAIFASNDEMAQGVIAKAHELGLRLPDALSVAGFDDTPYAAMAWPPLTTMRQPIAEMAAAATEMIIAGAGRSPRPQIPARRFECELVVRGSTAPPQ